MNRKLLCVLLCFGFIGLWAMTGTGTSTPVATDTVDPTLNLLSPSGGENWFIGDTHAIQWNASDPMLMPNPVYIWYSINGGAGYDILAEAVPNSGSYPWQLGNTPTHDAQIRIRVKDSFGNTTYKTSVQPFSIIMADPRIPEVAQISVLGSHHIVLNWLPVTETVNGYPLLPDGYLIFSSTNPFADESQYVFLADAGVATNYTHYNVARRAKKTFYRIVAYKDTEGRLGELLSSATPDSPDNFSLADLKSILSAKFGGVQ